MTAGAGSNQRRNGSAPLDAGSAAAAAIGAPRGKRSISQAVRAERNSSSSPVAASAAIARKRCARSGSPPVAGAAGRIRRRSSYRPVARSNHPNTNPARVEIEPQPQLFVGDECSRAAPGEIALELELDAEAR